MNEVKPFVKKFNQNPVLKSWTLFSPGINEQKEIRIEMGNNILLSINEGEKTKRITLI
ncbi:hypothetical protein Bmyc01_59140 [Bacillus mycoides]|uniref:hypothetical protein n=1 Tax=Bacillus TaxID=1386 RepID=UPI001A20756E|nr:MULTISPECIES: hypothetical protein [Bacillus]MBJ8190696.1 hypothetical protein [Bacillus cereus]GLV67245.1 hypothetical protein Bmyc01_59140 [Bacillus mycoides]MCX2829627.1 hypothetical protein [Bacillus sp. DHT2]MDR4918967.1 hypothetical protein [Bacillus pseudomycoides]MED1512007.1 hypothetical protein [Bacillus proteolyticus]